MIPMLLKIKIPRTKKPSVNIYLPLILAWFILLMLLILLLPFFLLSALIIWAKGYGRLILIFFPMLIELIWNLHGLKIDIKNNESEIYLSFI